jgi:hypothetical protein
MYIDPYEVGVFPMVSLSHIGEREATGKSGGGNPEARLLKSP